MNCKTDSYSKVVLAGIQEETLLSFLFFSKKNIEIIQNLIRKKIYDMSNNEYVIGYQNSDELLIIMRSIYLEYSKNVQDVNYITPQIKYLNKKVVDDVIPNILSAIKLYVKFLNDSSTPYHTMEHPKFESMSGTKSYDLSKFL